MSVVIRLSRQGAKKKPNYLVVAIDKMKKREGEYLEKLGQYFPKADKAEAKLKIDMRAFERWKAKGAQVSETVGQLVKTLAK
ncbi:MAG: 30S ribosomal protein S16 [Bacteriovoracia bacterium]